MVPVEEMGSLMIAVMVPDDTDLETLNAAHAAHIADKLVAAMAKHSLLDDDTRRAPPAGADFLTPHDKTTMTPSTRTNAPPSAPCFNSPVYRGRFSTARPHSDDKVAIPLSRFILRKAEHERSPLGG